VTHPKSRKDFKPDHEIGSRNVYADLGRAAAGSLFIKAQLVSKISEILEEQGLTQIKAAALLGINPNFPTCSAANFAASRSESSRIASRA
jgi:hypothetical protein